MTGLYNLVEALRAGTPLDATGEQDVTDARARIVLHLYDQLDAAVAAAYDWPADLSGAEIVARLVALNATRAAEEAAGQVGWLRPDYRIARFGAAGAGRRRGGVLSDRHTSETADEQKEGQKGRRT